jgi:protein-L-isoaspartate(D-aspartate) O-methyltransferase
MTRIATWLIVLGVLGVALFVWGPPQGVEGTAAAASEASARADERARMLEEIEADVRATAGTTRVEKLGPRVRQALLDVPRHAFVPDAVKDQAYANVPLPIGREQTISQPFIVALMTELAQLGPDDVVLEVGTGSGYQAAILARLARRVDSIEIVRELADSAAARLTRLGFANVSVRAGDGYLGWPEHAPFDAIVVTAGATEIPAPLVEQLRPGGRLVIPIGPDSQRQELVLLAKDAEGRTTRRTVLPVRFVPLLRELR